MNILILAFYFASCFGLGFCVFRIRLTSNGYRLVWPTMLLRFVCLLGAFAFLALAAQRLGVAV